MITISAVVTAAVTGLIGWFFKDELGALLSKLRGTPKTGEQKVQSAEDAMRRADINAPRNRTDLDNRLDGGSA